MIPFEDDPRSVRRTIADVERCARPAGRHRTGMLVVEGLRLHERALRAGRHPHAALVARAMLDHPTDRERRLMLDLAAAGTRLLRVDDAVVEALMDGRGGGAIVGLAPRPDAVDLADLATDRPNGVFLVLAGVEDPGNLGALARTALAAGAEALVVVAPADPFHPKSVRTSMGAVLKIPIVVAAGVDEMFDAFRRVGVRTVGAASEGGRVLPQAALAPPVAVVLGGESFGLSDDVLARVDETVTIPMSGEADSFSVNAAAAIVLYEILRSPEP